MIPTLTSITPNYGVINGGTVVTIVGTNFEAVQGTGTVEFNGVEATSYISWEDTEIICVTPIGSSYAKVTITNDSADTLDGAFLPASWESICTDGFLDTSITYDWTDVCTDGIFTWGGFVYTGTLDLARHKLICVHLRSEAKVGSFY